MVVIALVIPPACPHGSSFLGVIVAMWAQRLYRGRRHAE